MGSPLDAMAKAAQDMIADIETAAEGNAELYTRWCMERFGRPDSRGMWKDRAEKAEAEVRTLREDVQQFMDRLGPHWFLEQNWFPESAAALRAKEP
jgi:hypothetical protein